jgi:hypothetical protein
MHTSAGENMSSPAVRLHVQVGGCADSKMDGWGTSRSRFQLDVGGGWGWGHWWTSPWAVRSMRCLPLTCVNQELSGGYGLATQGIQLGTGSS